MAELGYKKFLELEINSFFWYVNVLSVGDSSYVIGCCISGGLFGLAEQSACATSKSQLQEYKWAKKSGCAKSQNKMHGENSKHMVTKAKINV